MKKEEFDLQYREGGAKKQKGIWLKIDDVDYLVNPYALSNSLCANEHHSLDLCYFASADESTEYYEDADISMTISDVEFGVTGKGCFNWKTKRRDYFKKVLDSLTLFCNDCKKSVPAIYGKTIEKKHLEAIEKQLHYPFYLWGPYQLTINDITIEKFTLDFGKYNSCDIDFTAKIGNRTLKSHISEWSADFDYIRHQMENLTFNLHSGDVGICFEDEPTIFRFTPKSALTGTKEVDKGTVFNYKDLMFVQIIPNEFTKTPAIMGYCEFEETIRTMYESILQLGYVFASSAKYNSLDWHYSCGLSIYNTLKSDIVENYLCPDRAKPEVVKRQTVVSHIITICCDEERLGFLENGESIYIILNAKDIVCIEGLRDIVVKGIKRWEKQMLNADDNFDWAKWDDAGMKFAQEIRNRIPDDYDIWYQKHNGKRSLLLKSL